MQLPFNDAGHAVPLVNWVIVIVASIIAMVIDVRCRRIPNNLTFPLFFAGFVWAVIHGGFSGLNQALAGMAIAGLPFFVLWMIGGGGAGDAKMMLAVGTWLGIQPALAAVFAVAIAGGILSLVYAKAHQRLLMAVANTTWMFFSLPLVLLGPGGLSERQKWLPASADAPLKTPYSVAILAGVCAAAAWIKLCAT
jgi:Flp pilus assembly protein protease CpaA